MWMRTIFSRLLSDLLYDSRPFLRGSHDYDYMKCLKGKVKQASACDVVLCTLSTLWMVIAWL